MFCVFVCTMPLTSITDQQEGISSRSMGYDGLDRLTTANSPGVWGSASYSYDALDNIRTSMVGGRSSVHTGVGFTGHVNDADTGLVYMQQRYYDPIAARFLSEDPVTTDANTGKSFARYAYANNSPYRYIDPDGRDPGLENLLYLSWCQ